MPKKSVKTEILDFLIESCIMELDLLDESGNEEEIDEVLDCVNDDIFAVVSSRCEIYERIPKSKDWIENILPTLDEDWYRQMLRVNSNQFQHILKLIEGDEEFKKPRSCQQFPVALQLAIVLFRLGSSGESASIRKISAVFGVGDGGTINKIIRRIFKAILKLKNVIIFWPDKEERDLLVAETQHELPHCIGYLDGTEIKLQETPGKDSVSYFSRTRKYSIKAQIICDHKLKIRHATVGYPGSVHDARMFANCPLAKYPERYFSGPQWIAADSAYTLTETVITPFRTNSRMLTAPERIFFNLTHSQFRVRVEHCFGILKERFSCLKELKISIHNDEDHIRCCNWVLVCCILHNILIPDDEANCSYELPETNIEDVDESTNSCSRKAEIKRQAIFMLLKENI